MKIYRDNKEKKILQWLLNNRGQWLTARQITKSKFSWQKVNRFLNFLVEQKLINSYNKGNRKYYKLVVK